LVDDNDGDGDKFSIS